MLTFAAALAAAISNPTHALPMAQRPGQVTDAALTIVHSDKLQVEWSEPAHSGGHPIDQYRIEWAQEEMIQAVQAITVSTGTTLTCVPL